MRGARITLAPVWHFIYRCPPHFSYFILIELFRLVNSSFFLPHPRGMWACDACDNKHCVCSPAAQQLCIQFHFHHSISSKTKINIFLILNFAITLKIECKSDEHTSRRQRCTGEPIVAADARRAVGWRLCEKF